MKYSNRLINFETVLYCTVLQDHPRGGGGVQGADGLLRGLLLHPRREADQGPSLQVAHTIANGGLCNI